MTLKPSASCYHPTPWKESYQKIKFNIVDFLLIVIFVMIIATLVYVFLPTTHCLDYCSFISLELRSWPPNWFFTITPPILLLHICFRIIVNIHKITCWDFNWDCIESTDQVRKKLTRWQYCLPIHKHGMSSSVSTLHWFTEVL